VTFVQEPPEITFAALGASAGCAQEYGPPDEVSERSSSFTDI
jgi:hypothetical protein